MKKIEKYIKLKDLLEYQIEPFLLGALINRTMQMTVNGLSYFYTYTDFKTNLKALSKKCDEKFIDELIQLYDKHSGYLNWTKHNISDSEIELRFYILNEQGTSLDDFLTSLIKTARNELDNFDINNNNLTPKMKSFIRGYFEPRGSIDTGIPFISIDYFYNTLFEKAVPVSILRYTIGIPSEYLNVNFRELQWQYTENISKRNTQLRINSFYYAKNVGFINSFKAEVFQRRWCSACEIKRDENGIIYFNVDVPKSRNRKTNFLGAFEFHDSYIEGNKNLSAESVVELRKRQNLPIDKESEMKPSRDQRVIDLAKKLKSNNVCECCGSDSQTYEYHHMIPFSRDVESDTIDNIVKLCPNCHSSIHRCNKMEKVNMFIKILHNTPSSFRFIQKYFNEGDIVKLATKLSDFTD